MEPYSEDIDSVIREALLNQMQPVREEISSLFPLQSEIRLYENGTLVKSFELDATFFLTDLKQVIDAEKDAETIEQSLSQTSVIFTKDDVKYFMEFGNSKCYYAEANIDISETVTLMVNRTAWSRNNRVGAFTYGPNDVELETDPRTLSDCNRLIKPFNYMMYRSGGELRFVDL